VAGEQEIKDTARGIKTAKILRKSGNETDDRQAGKERKRTGYVTKFTTGKHTGRGAEAVALLLFLSPKVGNMA
jgi:hypothetical protein